MSRIPLLSLLFTVILVATSLADWPQFMHDAANSGVAESALSPADLGLQQQVKLDEAILTSPAIVDDQAFVIDQMGTAYCVELSSGTIAWKTPLPAMQRVSRDLAVTRRRQRSLADNWFTEPACGRVISLNRQSGERLWSYDCGWPIVGSVTVSGDRLYVPSVDSSLHCLSIKERWQASVALGSLRAQPAMDGQLRPRCRWRPL